MKHRLFEHVFDQLVENLSRKGVGVTMEDNYPGFKNFFVTLPSLQLEELCKTVEVVLIDSSVKSTQEQAIEFYCRFYTTKGKQDQRRLGKNNFQMVKQFIKAELFDDSHVFIEEFLPVKRDYRTETISKIFVGGVPGVVITVGGRAKLRPDNKQNNQGGV